MEQLNFRNLIYEITDLLYFVPIVFAMLNWEKLAVEQKWFTIYFVLYAITTIVQYIVLEFYNSSNSFCFFIYSLIDCFCIFQMYKTMFQKQANKKAIVFLFAIGFCSLLVDLFWLTGFKNSENYFSEVVISICIFIMSILYLIETFTNNIQKNINELNVFIGMCFMIKYFLKAIFSFFHKYLFETQVNFYLIVQLDNFYNFFIIVTLMISTFIFYKLKFHSNEI